MALYRKYRPATFAEVVGQSHVTEPLSVALDSGRINHAYLFSGPRGCGKTSSARILARSLNCVEGPTSTPCGKCESCVSLAPGGPGNLDVTELDAATHNGVDDMRELRERAFYAPAESRYRVFIIDEAHMISTAGFNALLKIVEEPPEHLIFIFATTEPEKLLQTIRSRTHNYPFRLLAPPDMRGLLESVVSGEGVPVEDAVYPLVIRAGGGSPRDSLSIMDQLLAGAGPEGVTYNRALALLGVTDSTLIDRAVDALAEHDSAALFAVVDEVIDAGYDPRRFSEDLLDRFRDLLVVQAVPDAFERGLVNAPEESRDVLREQAEKMGQATLTRCASLVNEGLAQMRGATAPRLLLEILCARMALPAAGMTVEALAQRVEALEKGNGGAGGAGAGSTGSGVGSSGAGTRAGTGVGTGVRGSRAEMFARRRKAAQDAAQQPASEQPEPAQAEPAQRAENAPEQNLTAGQEPAAVQPPAQSVKPSEVVAEASPAKETAQEVSPGTAQGTERGTEPETAQETAEESPAIAEARRARDIMQRHRQASAAESAAATEEPTPAETVNSETPPAGSEPVEVSAEASTEASMEASAEAAATIDSDSWARIMDAVHGLDLSAWIALRGASPRAAQPTPGEVHVDHHTGSLARLVSGPKNAEVYSQAIQDVTGSPARIVVYVGDEVIGAGATESSGSAGSVRGTEGAKPAGGDEPGKSEPAAAQPSAGEGQTPASTPANPVPAETPMDATASRSAASSALERARAMEEAMRKASHSHRNAGAAADTGAAGAAAGSRGAAGTGAGTAGNSSESAAQEDPNSGWRARAERAKARKKYNMENGFNGVPLPDEPPVDAYGDAPVDTWDGSAAASAAADLGANPAVAPAADVPLPPEPSDPTDLSAPSDQSGQPGSAVPPAASGPSARAGEPPARAASHQPHAGMGSAGDEGASQRTEQSERDELLADLERAPGQRDHRTPLEIAGELIEKSLGAERVR
ncbi:DNA polymerase III subunit gamma and tau [Corynebacterium jeikeium]|uniref:DNA polymerase III subunit gamma and tau n=1 Tax=Corynebacterium jeikeium TaxID=38289 RepID=UPI0005508700|nr:DNA polymerase III subunit gamma and tau [Corynebacterium jeikeium]SQI19012.1 DNA polymerase III subunits gamma and tau [Corynebacterium jeikeium]